MEAWVDANRVLRALRNLLDNALRYAPDGPVALGLEQDGSTAVITVADCGPGVPAEDLPRLHERFFRSAQAVEAGTVGTGLGLSTVQAVADMHEGTLELRSEPGGGLRVALRLPLRRPAER